MSGGVDSAVAALLLKKAGYEVTGLFMRNWKEKDEAGRCTSDEDYADVRAAAGLLGIPYYAVDMSGEYMDRVFKKFVDAYEKGLTPNPDVLCNREIKFGVFAEYARKLGADYVATGHYCNILKRDGKTYLARAKDENKCQTYFLNQVSARQLENVLFPVGNLLKSEVREIARKAGIPSADKKDSTGVCFIGERDFRRFLKNYIHIRKGEIKTLDGETVGTHDGVYYYTVGQRRGFGLGGAGEPWYIVRRDVAENVLYVHRGECPELFTKEIRTNGFNFITGEPESDEFRVLCRIRHRQLLQKALFVREGADARIIFDEKQRAAAAGQYAVVYETDSPVCLGGGEIKGVEPL